MWLFKCLPLFIWVLERDHSCEDWNLNYSGEQRKDGKPKGLFDWSWSQLSGQVVYHSENNTIACIWWLKWRIHGLRTEWSVLVCVQHVRYVVLGCERGGCWIRGGKRMKVQGKWQMPPFVWTYSEPLSYRNQVYWRTGSWVKEGLLRGYFGLLLWMLLLLVCLCMHYNHGDHVFSRLVWVKVVSFNIYLGKYGHHSYGLQRRMILR